MDPNPAHASGAASWRTSWKREMIINRYLVDANYDIGGKNLEKMTVQITGKSFYWKGVVETKISKETVLCSAAWKSVQQCQ